MVYSLLHPLDLVVPVGGPVVRSLLDHSPHVGGGLDLAHVQHEPVLQIHHRLLQEARQPRIEHKPHQVDNMLVVPAGNQEALNHQVHVQLERLAVDLASHDLYHFFSQLEVRSLKAEVVGWRDVEDEPKVYMDEVSLLLVDQDIAVMPVLDLQDVGDNGVGGL